MKKYVVLRDDEVVHEADDQDLALDYALHHTTVGLAMETGFMTVFNPLRVELRDSPTMLTHVSQEHMNELAALIYKVYSTPGLSEYKLKSILYCLSSSVYLMGKVGNGDTHAGIKNPQQAIDQFKQALESHTKEKANG